MHDLRRDPAAMALLLFRCHCGDPLAALQSSSQACEGGVAAVVRQALELLKASAVCGGPYTAPAPLLQALLCEAARAGDTPSVRALLDLPDLPDINGLGGTALCMAVHGGPHLPTVQALLERGADPSRNESIVFYMAGATQQLSAALPLLLQHCPPAAHGAAVTLALNNAINNENMPGVEQLLPRLDEAGLNFLEFARMAAFKGLLAVLQRLLDHHCSAEILEEVLAAAVYSGQEACVVPLLDRGALLHTPAGGVDLDPLRCAVFNAMHEGAPEGYGLAMVRLLLQLGAQGTPDLIEAVCRSKNAALLGILQQGGHAPAAQAGAVV